MEWPDSVEELRDEQFRIGSQRTTQWSMVGAPSIGGVFVCFARGGSGAGAAGDAGWAAAAGRSRAAVVHGAATAPYQRGFLALREGPLLAAAVRALEPHPEVLIVNATGRDHPRRCGLALHLGAFLGIPTVGVTHRSLLATGEWPGERRWSRSTLALDGEVVGFWLRTREGARPICVHAAWRTDPDLAVEIVRRATGRFRTPEPLRRARTAARGLRAMG